MKSKSLMYATFALGTAEIAVELEAVSEVVNYPEQVTAVPLAPGFVTGLFNLRGLIIPILDLAAMMGLETESVTQRKIAVLQLEGVKVGLAFDAAKEIVRITEAEFLDYTYTESTGCRALKGALKLEGGQRIVHLVNLPELIQIENLPYITEAQAKESQRSNIRTQEESSRKQIISFTVGSYLLGLGIDCISEIIMMPEFDHSALASDLCMGKIEFRQRVLPLVSLSHLLGQQEVTDNRVERLRDSKILVLKLDGRQFGLVVENLKNIVTFYESDVKPVPLFSRDRKGFLSGCLARSEFADVMILDQKMLLSDEELKALTEGHSQLYDDPAIAAAAKKSASTVWDRYITFTVAHKAALKMLEIQEIVSMPSQILQSPGASPWVKGILNLRGNLVSVIDLRLLYDLPILECAENQQILVLKSKSAMYGLVVDSIDGTLTVDREKKMQIPASFYPPVGEEMLSDLKEFIDPFGEFPIKEKIMVLDIESLIERIAGPSAAA